MPSGLGRVDVTAPAMLQAATEHVGGHGAAAIGRDGEPAPRQGRVFFDTATVQQDLPQQ
ncbi:hypothetical protein D3C80_2194780 [compost metagenome]